MPRDRDCSWLPEVVSIFMRWPDVGIIGLRGYLSDVILGYDNKEIAHFRDPVTKVCDPVTKVRDPVTKVCDPVTKVCDPVTTPQGGMGALVKIIIHYSSSSLP